MTSFYKAPTSLDELKTWNFKIQPALSQLNCHLKFKQLFNSATTTEEKMQLTSQQGKGAAQFLFLMPKDYYSTMKNEEFGVIIREFLGMPLAGRYLPGQSYLQVFSEEQFDGLSSAELL